MAGFEFTDIHILKDLKRLRDSTNLVVASRLFRDRRRFEVFSVLYAAMREIDDLVDSVVELNPSPDATERIREKVLRWETVIHGAYAAPGSSKDPDIEYFRKIFSQFPIPQELWNNFFHAMWKDFHGLSFQNYEDFLEYAEGASVAATTIYLMLIGAEKKSAGEYFLDNFDYIQTGRDLGVWAYTVHIIRDLKDDLLTGLEGRVLLPQDMMTRYGLTPGALRDLAESGQGYHSDFRQLLAEFYSNGEDRGHRGKTAASDLALRIPPHRQTVLCLIIAIYSELSRRISGSDFNVMGEGSLFPPEDRERLVREIMGLRNWNEMRALW